MSMDESLDCVHLWELTRAKQRNLGNGEMDMKWRCHRCRVVRGTTDQVSLPNIEVNVKEAS